MDKPKDTHTDSNEKYPISRFFTTVITFVAVFFTGDLITSLIEKEPFDWKGRLLTFAREVVFLTVIYFISRFLAYRTKIFPKIKNREGLQWVSFILLSILAIVLLFFL